MCRSRTLTQQGGVRKTVNIGSKGWDLRSVLSWCLFSITGSADPISIGFLPKKWQKLAKKSNSLVTYIFWAKIRCCTSATKDKSICRSIVLFAKGKFVLNLI